MSKPRARGGRATPKKRPETSPTRAELMAATEPVLQRLFGDYPRLHGASPLEVELRASVIWSVIGDDAELYKFVLQLLGERLRQGRADARDALRLLTTLVDRPLAARFNEILRQTPVAGLAPAWINQAGRATVERAVLYDDETGDRETLILVCRYPGAASPHAVAAIFDPNALHAVAHIDVFADYFDDDADLPETMRRRDVDLAEARARIQRGLTTAKLFSQDRGSSVVARGALLEHYSHKLPEGFELPERRPRTDDEIAALVDEFYGSPMAAGVDASPEARDAVATALKRAANLFDDPFHLTAGSIGVLSVAIGDQIRSDPDLHRDVLRALVRYAHERNQWGDRYLDATLAAVDDAITAERVAAPDPDAPSSR